MSRLCAKPTCGETAAFWLDILREDRRVVEHQRESLHGLALCGTHRDRFVVPAGWELEASIADQQVTESGETASVVAPHSMPVEASPERSTSRERPWFLVESASDAPVRPLLVDDGQDADDADDTAELSSGSLLRRAFQGPDRDDDRARRADAVRSEDSDDVAVEADADDDARYDRETERAIRSLDAYGTAQLPFPPVDTEVQARVS